MVAALATMALFLPPAAPGSPTVIGRAGPGRAVIKDDRETGTEGRLQVRVMAARRG
ncbi:hypothetical protein [Streptomyces sp. NRRL S-813]|uniref:hypothetical protein n=1 Tax=Streptomyces sp. NRRL S-813 TaxID=1463919 RepID=UPI000AB42C10|nr:hypothetical protein [Streptomyces sp. NRRL S-813]